MKYWILGIVSLFALLCGCKSTKFVPEHKYLLNKVSIKSDNKEIETSELKTYLRQTPNTKIFGLWKLHLGVYNLSGKDSTKWINKAFRKMGDEPVIYDPTLTFASSTQLKLSIQNQGYFNADVTSEAKAEGKKVNVTYNIKTGEAYKLKDYTIDLPQTTLKDIACDTAHSYIKPNMTFDINVLDAERTRIVTKMKNQGYYYFEKDFLQYDADSTKQDYKIDLNISIKNKISQNSDSALHFILQKYKIRTVVFHTNYNSQNPIVDTVRYGNYLMSYNGKKHIRANTLITNCFVIPGENYKEKNVERTYAALNSLAPINYVNISFEHVGNDMLDCYVVITPNKAKSFSVDLEGTYSGGDWGIASGLGYMHRNLFKGAEVLSVQTRAAYEWRETTGNALEAGGDIKLKFPDLLIPFIKNEQRRLINSNTEISTTYQYQKRPAEYTRSIAGVGVKYTWAPRQEQLWHGLDLFELSYVRLPWMSKDFKNYLANNSSILRYQYEDHLIMTMGYNGTYSNYKRTRPMHNHYTMRYGAEIAGNLLYGISKAAKKPTDENGIYTVFDVPFAQYAKADFDVVYHHIFSKEHRLVYHGALGLGYPYGNAEALPFEKRYYSGGANSIRGWTVRTLGPGNYQRTSSQFDFNSQTGDVRLDLSMEYRAELFWLLNCALFVDAGNIWTIKDYEYQPGGLFKIDDFYKQIAISYGLGLRFDFSFFILRFDLAMKAHDPGRNVGERWRYKNITWKDDFAFHFAIGYPF